MSTKRPSFELNMDGLVGPTHHYAGLAPGNLASTQNALSEANPQAAALQGLDKMRLLHQIGFKQAVLPPHQRPNIDLLSQLGFTGSATQQINTAYRTAPRLLSACYSASSMWAANTATVSPSVDTHDGKVHFTAANLVSHLHRHQEAHFSKQLLATIFADSDYFTHHPILPRSSTTSDEGAANHNRLCLHHHTSGIHLFIYGKEGLANNQHGPQRYPARQTLEASRAIARANQLSPQRVLFARQNPEAIDAGVFHNDVIAVANESILLAHEAAFVDQAQLFKQLIDLADFPLQIIQIKTAEIGLKDAVDSYLFNAQLLTHPGTGDMLLIAPTECQSTPSVKKWLDALIATPSNPINQVYYVDLKQSMRNGGGPACLRLRIPLSEKELAASHAGIMITNKLLDQLTRCIKQHYRTSLSIEDLRDPQLVNESLTVLDEFTQILQLGSIYPFQKEH